MTKKDIVRSHLDKLVDKANFNLRSVAAFLGAGVEVKDVSNVVAEYKAEGRVTDEVRPGDKHKTYTVVGNVNAPLAKKAANGKPIKTKQDSADAYQETEPQFDKRLHKTVTPAPRRKVRSPLVRAIDDEIKALEGKIKDLRRVRKDYE